MAKTESKSEAQSVAAASVIGDVAALRAALAGAAVVAVPLNVPQLGGLIHILPMTTRDILNSASDKLPETATPEQETAWGVARWLSDAAGNRLVKASDLETLSLFQALPWSVSRQILQAAGVMNEDEAKNA